MMITPSDHVQKQFQSNLKDWFLGGPKFGGWTRTGPQIPEISCNLVYAYFQILSVDECLAKNAEETKKWHIDFLLGNGSAYRQEYLSPRYDYQKAENRMTSFMSLFKDIEMNGIKIPVWMADISQLGLGFKYFRFDGCHRLCCAKVIGIQTVPAFVFKIEAL